MAGANLLALIDDIATLLDDIAVLSKVAARKTAGVLGDDLALSAEQVSGVRAERELPIVWAVAKGSFKNKLILIPAAMLISAFAPWAVTLLLMIGGLYLCFEGAEKLAHKFFHNDDEGRHQQMLKSVSDPHVDLVSLERNKISGAIRTDFILSAEIIIITLGSVQSAPLMTQLLIVSGLGILFTVGVYGLVAAIVKLDDAGLYLLNSAGDRPGIRRSLGRVLLLMAPGLMKLLSIVGTAAMFLVGGGILLHGLPFAHHWVETALISVEGLTAAPLILPVLLNGVAGLVAGAMALGLMNLFQRLRGITP